MCTVPYIDYCTPPVHISALPGVHAWQWSSVSGYWSTPVTEPALLFSLWVEGKGWEGKWDFCLLHSSIQEASGCCFCCMEKMEKKRWWLDFLLCFCIQVQSAWFHKICKKMSAKWFVGCFSSELKCWWELQFLDEMFTLKYTCLISLITIWGSNTAERLEHILVKFCQCGDISDDCWSLQ